MYRLIKKSFYERPALVVAKDLIGCRLSFEDPKHGPVGGIVVETEAYTTGDAACHAWHLEQKRKKNPQATGRGAELFGEPGLTYVYLNYGMYWLLNVVTDPLGVPGGVLIRAVEPTIGESIVWKNRPNISKREQLTNGPGKLTLGIGITGHHHQLDVTRGPIYFEKPLKKISSLEIATSSRIGITQATDLEWRFYLRGNSYVSPAKPSSR